MIFMIFIYFEYLKRKYHLKRKRILTFFGQNHATKPLLIYKLMLKHHKKVINEFLKEEQVMVCSILFYEWKCENLKTVRLAFFKSQFIQTQSVCD